MATPIIQVNQLIKFFTVGSQDIQVLKELSFEINSGDFVIIFGPSGCGKSTLLHTLLGLEVPSQGKVSILNYDLYRDTTEDDRAEFRKKHIGMIYQQPNWIKALSVRDNVAFPLSLLGVDKNTALSKADTVLQAVGMTNWAEYIPTELSSGQQQRVALARGIVTDPQIIVADEPTGNLDFQSGQDLMKMLVAFNQKGHTILMVTHDLEYLSFAQSAIQMFDGEIKGHFKGKEKEALADTLQAKSKRGSVGHSVINTAPRIKHEVLEKETPVTSSPPQSQEEKKVPPKPIVVTADAEGRRNTYPKRII